MKTRISPKTSLRKSAGMPDADAPGGGPTTASAGAAAAGGVAGAPLRDGPGVQEQQLHVEQQEHDRHQVVADVEPLPGVADRVHARLVRHLLDGRRLLRAQEGAAQRACPTAVRIATRMNRKIGVNSDPDSGPMNVALGGVQGSTL